MDIVEFRLKNDVRYIKQCCQFCKYAVLCPDSVVKCEHPDLGGGTTYMADTMVCDAFEEGERE